MESKEYQKKYREDEINKKKASEYQKKYREKNRDKLIAYQKEWRNNNKERYYLRVKKHREKYADEYRIKNTLKAKYKRDTDRLFRLKTNLRNLIKNALTFGYNETAVLTNHVLKCSHIEFKQHLESLFEDGMNWDNYNTYWRLRYIKPFKQANTVKELMEVCYYKNIIPNKIKN